MKLFYAICVVLFGLGCNNEGPIGADSAISLPRDGAGLDLGRDAVVPLDNRISSDGATSTDASPTDASLSDGPSSPNCGQQTCRSDQYCQVQGCSQPGCQPSGSCHALPSGCKSCSCVQPPFPSCVCEQNAAGQIVFSCPGS
ncbi:MAG: hypothetical protein H6707_13965 [Deltaproteobacteria bacterium]|nr:hypothetical protein [Deltaproteobacteria bacterium]